MTLAVIGTAGRGSDAQLLTAAHWRMMVTIAQTVACTLNADHLVSGGSAWADAVAVDLYLNGHAKALTLHLPAALEHTPKGLPRFDETSDAGRRLNQLHDAVFKTTGIDHIDRIWQAWERGAKVCVNAGGFLARNADVAAQADALLAMTFGPLRDESGTAHTVRLFLARRTTAERDHHAHGMPFPDDMLQAFHFDLHARLLTRL